MNLEPTPLLPFRLHNIKDFLNQEHPRLHPGFPEYKHYWQEQMGYCIDGKWGEDKDKLTGQGGWRWMPGNLYFYINMWVIEQEGEEGTQVDKPPLLRDVEWYIFYALAECEGFSGFDGDDEYTSYRPVGKIQDKIGGKLLNIEKEHLEENDAYLRKPNGEYKTYVPAREYLYKTHDKPLGKPRFFNGCQDFMLLSTRSVGKSYSLAGGVIGHEFVFGGARDLDEYLSEESKSTVVVGSGDKKYSVKLLEKFKDGYNYIREKVGGYKDSITYQPSPLWRPTDGSLSVGADNPYTNKVKLKQNQGLKGPGSVIQHVTYQSNPGAAVGSRARKILVDEVGKVPKFKVVWGENQAILKRKTQFGFTAYTGTGGEVEKTTDVQDAFENPRAYNILPFQDKFSGVDREIACFIPSYYIDTAPRDKNGNTFYEEAFEDAMTIRNEKKKGSEIAYERHCISYPIVPQEMFLANANNPFPLGAIDDRLTELKAGKWKEKALIGRIDYTNPKRTGAKFIEDTEGELTPIYKWRQEKDKNNNSKEKDLEGSFVLYEKPAPYKPSYKDSGYPLYIVAYDSVLKEEGTSLCVATVFKTFDFNKDDDSIQYNIVAEWVGRMQTQNQNHDQVFRLAALYDCSILIENNLDDIKRFARAIGQYDRLEPSPWEALGKIKNIKSRNPNDVGIGMYGRDMIKAAENKLNDLLTTNTLDEREREYVGEEGLEEEVVKMVDKCWSMRFLEELKFYVREGNYDYVSAMMLISIWVGQLEFLDINPERKKKEATRVQEVLNHMKSINRRANPAFNY